MRAWLLRHRAMVGIGLLVGILCLVSWGFFSVYSRVRVGLRVSVESLSRAADGTTLALLRITNQSPVALFYYVAPAQARSAADWPALPNTFSGRALAPHAVEMVPVPVPDDGRDWRVPVSWSAEPTGLARLAAIVRLNWHLNIARLTRGRSPRWVTSPESDAFWVFCQPPHMTPATSP